MYRNVLIDQQLNKVSIFFFTGTKRKIYSTCVAENDGKIVFIRQIIIEMQRRQCFFFNLFLGVPKIEKVIPKLKKLYVCIYHYKQVTPDVLFSFLSSPVGHYALHSHTMLESTN